MEDFFDTLQNTPSKEIRKFQIPFELYKKFQPQDEENSIPVYMYDINRECFYYDNYQPVKSLFFEKILKESSKTVLKDYFIIKFCEKDMDDSLLERDKIVEEILTNGVYLNEKHFNIVGCSNSQVQKKSFVFMKGTREDCDKKLEHFIPDIKSLEEEKGVAKRVKYTGLLFTGCQYIVELPSNFQFEKTEDEKTGNKKYNFTDGCGFISLKLARKIRDTCEELKRRWKYQIPSVWQIRFMGKNCLCKGVVIVDFSNTKDSTLAIRPSMVKCKVSCLPSSFGIVDFSSMKVGKFNRQLVTLLSCNSDMRMGLLEIHQRYINGIEKSRTQPTGAVNIAAVTQQWKLFHNVLNQHEISKILPKSYVSMVTSIEDRHNSPTDAKKKRKMNVPIPYSQMMFGAAFPEKLQNDLRDGECIVCTNTGLYEGDIIVSRSPSYSVGDIRVLKAVKPDDQNNIVYQLRNVILFPTCGQRPEADKMSGGDLDGDMYLVIWHPDLLQHAKVMRKYQSHDYQVEQKVNKNTESWIRYISRWENSILAQVDNTFYYFANLKGVDCEECKELCTIFSRAVDQNPSDLKRLNYLASQCLFSRQSKSLIHTSDDKRQAWDVMEERYIDLRQCLQKREKLPSEKDWKEFYTALVFIDTNEVTKILQSPDICNCVTTYLIDQTIVFWKRLCRKPINKVNSQQANVQEICVFDCEDENCENFHDLSPGFYHSRWVAKSDNEINMVIKDTVAESDSIREVINKQEKLRQDMIDEEAKARREYDQKILELEPLKVSIKKLEDAKSISSDVERRLTAQVIEQPNWFGKITEWMFGMSEEKKRRLHERELNEKKQLCEIFKKLYDAENDIALKLGSFNIPHSIMMKPSECPTVEVLSIFNVYIEDLLQTTNQHKLQLTPKLRISWSSVGNLECIYSHTLSQQVNLVDQKNNLTSRLQCKESELQSLEADLCDCDNRILNFGLMKEELSALGLIEEVINWLFKYNDQLTNVSIYGELDDLFDDDINVRTRAEKQIPVLKQKWKNEIDEQLVSLSSSKLVLIKRKDMLMEEKNSLVNIISKVDQDLNDKNALLLSLNEMKENVYDQEKHNTLIDNYKLLTEKIGGFNLALCALHHEIDERYCHTVSQVTKKDRVAFNKELQLCLQREKKRCQRELSKNNLKVFSKRLEVKDALKQSNAVIIVAQTGSGKSTQIPQYLADDLHHILGEKKFPKIACTQPRRVACIRIAERVSLEYAGGVDVPVETTDVGKEKKPPVLSKRKVSAYPLYSKLSQDDQDRALDEDDREGYHVENKKRQSSDSSNGDEVTQHKMHGTPGEVGQWVGFQIGSRGKPIEEKKKAKKICKKTRIHFVTEGLLLQKLRNTSNQEIRYDCIIVDEAHERGKDTDLLLAHLQDYLKKVKEKAYQGLNLKVVVMSASINKEQFSQYFGGCPIVECEGRMFDVVDQFVPDKGENNKSSVCSEICSSNSDSADPNFDESWLNYQSGSEYQNKANSVEAPEIRIESKMKKKTEMHLLISHAVNIIFDKILPSNEEGDILVFLPGQREIHDCVDKINSRAEEEAAETISNCRFPIKKVVCCTNIAETSLTIPGVRYVLDAGKAKRIQYDHTLRVSALKLSDTSKAAGKQRKGRAGRVSTGWCFRLYSEEHFNNSMADYDEPEMKQTPIDELYLYCLDVFKSLEEIELMEDARPDPEAIKSAKLRLKNYGFIKEKEGKIEITEDGKFALSLAGELSLESVKMILCAQKYDVLNDAITLAVLLDENNIFGRDTSDSEETNEEKKNEEYLLHDYYDELGDHLTLLNVYKNFHKTRTKSGRKGRNAITETEEWCKKLNLNYGVLDQISKRIDTVYTFIKRMKDHKKTQSISQGQKNRSDKTATNKQRYCDHVKNLIDKEDREKLLRIVVGGYFHNIVVANDPTDMQAGYTLITPMNYGENDIEKINLLKPILSKDSILFQLGDVAKNTALIFHTLFQLSDGPVFMKVPSRIKADWITEECSDQWQSSVKINICNNKICSVFLESKLIQYVHPILLLQICKEKLLRDTKKSSNAKIRMCFQTGQIKIYGSRKEVKLAGGSLEPRVLELREEIVSKDRLVPFPKGYDSEPKMCEFTSGIKVNETNEINLPRPDIFTDWNEVQSATLIFHKDVSKHQVENFLQWVDNSLPSEYRRFWKKPDIDDKGNNFIKVKFRHQVIAQHAQPQHQNSGCFSRNTKCFLDRQVEIRVLRTSLYPSMQEIAKRFQHINITKKDTLFRVGVKRKNVPKNDTSVENFIEELKTREIFGRRLIRDFHKELGVTYFMFWCLKNMIVEVEEEYNVVVKCEEKPSFLFEIVGEKTDRDEAHQKFHDKIKCIAREVASSDSSPFDRTFVKRIQIPRHAHSTIKRKVNRIRKDNYYDNVKVTMQSNGLRNSDKLLSVVLIITDNHLAGIRVEEEIKKEIDGLQLRVMTIGPKCCICHKALHQKTSNEKKEDKVLLNKRRKDQGGDDSKVKLVTENEDNLPLAIRLKLCGCFYCKNCLEDIIEKKLEEHKDHLRHNEVGCYICGNVILMENVNYLHPKAQEKLKLMALSNHLRKIRRNGEFRTCQYRNSDESRKCDQLMFIESKQEGVYKCPSQKCPFTFCCGCHQKVTNEMEFEMHKTCSI